MKKIQTLEEKKFMSFLKKFYKLLILLLIFNNLYGQENLIDEYKIELIIFKHADIYSKENLNDQFINPNEEIINFYYPDLYINQIKINFFEPKNNIFNVNLDNIKIDYDIDKIKELNTINPFFWYRPSSNLSKLKKISKKIKNDGSFIHLQSLSWIQGIDKNENTKYLYEEDSNADYGYFIKFYKNRYLHVDIKAFLGKNNYQISYPVEDFLKKYNKSLKNNEKSYNKININMNFNEQNNLLLINEKKDNIYKDLDQNINIFINEERRLFDGDIHYFDHPYFGIILYIEKI